MRSTAKVVVGSVACLTALVGVVLALSTLSGCGQEKELPKGGVLPTDPRGSPPTVAPTVSDESARRVVERAIKVMTDGHPERVEKTRVNHSIAKGHRLWPVPNQAQLGWVETNRVFRAVYPDRVRADYEFPSEGK